MNIKRLRDHKEMEQHVLCMVHSDIKDIPDDGRWRNYERDFTFKGVAYTVKMKFRIDAMMLKYKNLHIEHKSKIIEINEKTFPGIFH